MQAESEEKSNPTDAPQTTESPATSADPETAESATATGAEAPQASDPVASPPATPAAESEATATGEPRRQIKIGSRQQRDGNTSSDSGTEPSVVAGTNSTAPNPIPTVRDPLPADLEKEIEEALGNTDLDEIVASEATMQVGDTLATDSKVRATVIRVHGDHVFFALGGPHEGAVSARQFEEPPVAGTQLEVIVSHYNNDDGLYELRLPGAAVDVKDWSDLQDGTVVEARITGANTGGLECMVNTIRGFIPASQIGVFRVENFADYIDKKLPCVVTEVNRRRRNLVLSHKAVLERQAESDRKERIATLAVGQIIEGTVSNIQNFGVFVNLGGIDGLIHISQLSWDRVEDPNEVVKKGQTVKVRVERINAQTGKIGLSYRALQEHPWTGAAEKFPTGTSVEGTVSRIAEFGAFVKLATGVEGLIHISELAHHRVSVVSSVVNEGEQVTVKILSVDEDAQRISLSLKALQDAPANAKKDRSGSNDDTPAWERTVPQRKEPLKGGRDKPSGGEQFGLKW